MVQRTINVLVVGIIAGFLVRGSCGCRRPSATGGSMEHTPRSRDSLQGTIVFADQEQAIVAVQSPGGQTHAVRPAPSADNRPGIWAVAGPDANGTVAFVEEYFPTPRHALKVIQLDGSGERIIVERPGDAIWKRALGRHLALSSTGIHLAPPAQSIGPGCCMPMCRI